MTLFQPKELVDDGMSLSDYFIVWFLCTERQGSMLSLFFQPCDHSPLHGLPPILRGDQGPGHLPHMKPNYPITAKTSGLSCHSQYLDCKEEMWKSHSMVFKGQRTKAWLYPPSWRDSNHQFPATPTDSDTDQSG